MYIEIIRKWMVEQEEMHKGQSSRLVEHAGCRRAVNHSQTAHFGAQLEVVAVDTVGVVVRDIRRSSAVLRVT